MNNESMDNQVTDRRSYDQVGYLAATLDSQSHRLNKLEDSDDDKTREISAILIQHQSHSDKILNIEKDIQDIHIILESHTSLLTTIKDESIKNNTIQTTIQTSNQKYYTTLAGIGYGIWLFLEQLPFILTLL